LKRVLIFCSIVLFFISHFSYAQTNELKIDAILDTENHLLKIQQEIIYFNNSESNLDTIYLHNWANGFKDKTTPLSKRLLENYNKNLYFAKNKNRGYSQINNISIDYSTAEVIQEEKKSDILKIGLKNTLFPGDSIRIKATYTVKVPSDKFTGYGRNKNSYNLRYWYLVPAVYDGSWNTMSNYDLDDIYMNPTDYQIHISVPKKYKLNSSLKSNTTIDNNHITYHLSGKKRVDIELNISTIDDFESIDSDNINIITNLKSTKLNQKVKRDIINREIAFIEKYLGKYPHEKLLINKITYQKNPVYGLNQLPAFLRPFSDTFEWDIKMFKALSREYIDRTIITNKRKDAWLVDGLQSFIMMKYVSENYPEIKVLGDISKLWGVRNFNLAQLNFNDKYPFVYQFAARKNVDQSLTTETQDLSNFNRKIVNRYKAGLGIRYLDEFIGDSLVPQKIKQFYNDHLLKLTSSNDFKELVTNETDLDLKWFFGDYIQSKKKIDYTIKNVESKNDSIAVTIENKSNMTAPVALYGIKDKDIHFKKWYSGIDSIKTVHIPKNGYDRLSLNYEYLYPEFNLRNNWKNTEKKLLNRPIQVKFLKDIEDPYYNQIYYSPAAKYNFYDGLQLGLSLGNKTFLKKNFIYKIAPLYSMKSKTLTGSFAFVYEYLPEDSKVYNYKFGIAGSYFHYAPELGYRTLTPFATVRFNRKSLRDVGGSALYLNYVDVKRDLNPTAEFPNPESNKYNVFNLGYSYSKPEILQDIRHNANLELGGKFSKLTYDFRYRRLTDKNRQFDFRFFAGAFLHNKTDSDFFSFGLSRQTDYLFKYNYLGRSEGSGFFSQQLIINEGGFKSDLPTNYANQWLASMNTSVGIWKWTELYNSVGLVKSKNTPVYFAYETGVRLNFIHEIMELYFPLHSNLGWEIEQENYLSKVRFVITLRPKKIINFIRRGYY